MIYYNCKYLMIIENYITIKKRNTCTVYSTRHRRMGPRGGGGWVVWGRRFWHSWRYVHQKQTAVLSTPRSRISLIPRRKGKMCCQERFLLERYIGFRISLKQVRNVIGCSRTLRSVEDTNLTLRQVLECYQMVVSLGGCESSGRTNAKNYHSTSYSISGPWS